MRVVVTGASGFIAGAVLRELEARKVDHVAVSRKAADYGGRRVVVGDYSHAPDGDVLIHLAESNNQSTTEKIGQNYISEATSRLEALLGKPFSKIVYASSATVYDTSIPAPQTTEQVMPPANIYAMAKLQCEKLVVGSGRGVVARIANVYGRGMSRENVVSRILEQLPCGGDIHIMDDNPVRDFIWIEDVACGLVEMALGDKSGIFNLGTGVGTSVGQLAQLSLGIYGTPDRKVIPENPSSGINSRILEISATRTAFAWSPLVELGLGLKKLITGIQA
jgi:nucleoside-diphosphate-sugar epimerase